MANFGLKLKNGNPPSGTPFPTTVEGFLALMTSYLEVSGLGDQEESDLLQLISGQNAPSANVQSTIWIKENNENRRVAVLSYNGDGFYKVCAVRTGAWADRPSDTVDAGEVYQATEGFTAIYTGSAWTTLDGSIGDIKYAIGASLQAVLDKNPGWREYTAGKGRSLVGVDNLDADPAYHNAENTFGTQKHQLNIDEMPTHKHTGKCYASDDAAYSPVTESGLGATAQHENAAHTTQSGTEFDLQGPVRLDDTGGDQPHENRPPSITAFILEKYI